MLKAASEIYDHLSTTSLDKLNKRPHGSHLLSNSHFLQLNEVLKVDKLSRVIFFKKCMFYYCLFFSRNMLKAASEISYDHLSTTSSDKLNKRPRSSHLMESSSVNHHETSFER